MSEVIYRVTFKNWSKYNGKLKSGHRSVLISEAFLDDAKIASLRPTGRLLVLALLLSCRGPASGVTECRHSTLVRQTGCRHSDVVPLLTRLQSLQILTFEVFTSLINRIEEKGIEGAQLSLVPAGTSVAPHLANQNSVFIIKRVEDFNLFLEPEVWENWAKIYDREYMNRELVGMVAWLIANPAKNRKTRRGLIQFVSGWYARGWDRWVNKIPSQSGHESSFTGVSRYDV